MSRRRNARKRYQDESYVALLMDLPIWAIVFLLAVLWLVLVTVYFLLAHVIPPLKAPSGFVGGVLIYLFIVIAFWLALGERSLRRRRLQAASSLYRLRGLSAYDFQDAVSELFRLLGYVVTENKRQDAEDGGVDLEIAKGGTFLVQVKHKWDDVGVKDIRELWGIVASEGAAGAIFVTSGGYSPRAREFAHGKNYWLINGEEFLRLRREALPADDLAGPLDHDPVVSDGFARYLAGLRPPACESCGKPMLPITHLAGATVTKKFWGCPGFRPDDRSTWHPTRYLAEYVPDGADAPSSGPISSRWRILRSNRLRLRTPAGSLQK